MAGKKLYKRTPTASEYVVYRNRKGKLTKPRGGVYLVAEIRNRKTGKVTGYLNSQNKKSKKPNPQRFTAIQRRILTTPKSIPITQKPPRKENSWYLTAKKPILEQIPLWLTKRVNQEVNISGHALVSIELSGKTFTQVRTAARFIQHKMSHKESSAMFAIDILNVLRNTNVRMSPKQKSDKRRREGKVLAQLIFLSFD